jgi:hypothetical protein
MLSSTVKEVSWFDSFDLPSIFDPRLQLYKEWHDFVFFDRAKNIFGLLNFAVHGNPYDAKRGYGAALAFVVAPTGKIHTELKLIPITELDVSPYSPEYISKYVSVHYVSDSFEISGKIDKMKVDLSLPVVAPPITMSQIGSKILSNNRVTMGMVAVASDMARVWDKWVELPRLEVSGTIEVGGSTYTIDTNTGYQDHEGGRFDWSSIDGWDTGVLLCDPGSGEPEKVSFLFYKYGPLGEEEYGGIIVRRPDGTEKYFESDLVSISRTGEFKGERAYLPGVTKLLYPDYHPKIPEATVFSAVDGPDHINITFTPRAVCTIVVASVFDGAEVTFNEMHCDAKLEATVGGQSFNATIPCWFESVRPRRRP